MRPPLFSLILLLRHKRRILLRDDLLEHGENQLHAVEIQMADVVGTHAILISESCGGHVDARQGAIHRVNAVDAHLGADLKERVAVITTVMPCRVHVAADLPDRKSVV